MPWSKIQTCAEPKYAEQFSSGRTLPWAEATREALTQAMELDPSVFIMGQGVDDPSGMFGVTKDLHKRFGGARVFDTPLAENALTGIAVGAAQAGMRPVYFHNRPDFLYLAMDQLVNHAAKWSGMFAGQVPVPLVIWACTGRGWGSGAQHSQTIHGMLMQIPGLKVVMPATCQDAKGFMLAAISDNNPVVILDHRRNFAMSGTVPAEPYRTPFGKAAIRRSGSDVTIVAISHLVHDAWLAAEELAGRGIEAEVIDLRSLRPLDEQLVLASIAKTGRLVVADTGGPRAGAAAEIAAVAAGGGQACLKAPVARVTPADAPTPAGHVLENAFYIGKEHIVRAVLNCMGN